MGVRIMSNRIVEIDEVKAEEAEGTKRLGISFGQTNTERGEEIVKKIQEMAETKDYEFQI